MNDIDVTQLMTEMRRLAELAQSPTSQPAAEEGGFAELLRNSVDGVNEAQMSAAEIAEAFDRGHDRRRIRPPAARRQPAGSDDCAAEGEHLFSGDDRSAQPPCQRLPGNHEHADLTVIGSARTNG